MSARCPVCREGALFDGILKFKNRCEQCGADFSSLEDIGDGPAVFVIFIVSIFIVPIPVLLSVLNGWPSWLSVGLFIPVITAVSIWLLRLLRAAMFHQQWRKAAIEQRFSNKP